MEAEKEPKPAHKEDASHTGDLTPTSLESAEGLKFDAARTKRLLRKLDWHLVPFVTLLYLMSFLDRTNIGNARLVGLEKDLHMHGLDYNIALAVFTPFYILIEVPSNMMMKRTSPSLWISIIMTCWGVTMTLMGIVTSFTGLMVARMALGLAEGGLFPGVIFYMTMWYKRDEVGYRMGIFYSAATLAGAFGGLLARGISQMAGIGGKDGWSWIFILEGIVTTILAVVAYWGINDYPETSKFLTPEEKQEVVRRLKSDTTSLANEYHTKYVWQAFKDWKIYVHMFITLGIFTPLYSISLFLPTIVENMGFSDANQTQLLTVPPYVFACLTTVTGGILADKYKQRGIFMIFFCLMGIVGFVMLISTAIPGVQYLGTFLAAGGIYPNVAMGVAWDGNNIGGSTKRAVGLAMHVMFGSIGGAIAAFTYRSTDAPRYFAGHGELIGMTAMAMVLSIFMTIWLRGENARRDRVMRSKGINSLDDYTEEMKLAEREKGDYASFFRYMI